MTTTLRSMPENPQHLPEICQIVLQQIGDTAIVYADRDGAIRGWNAGATALLGYTPAEIIGLHVSQLYTKADRLAGKPLEALQVAGSRGQFGEEGPRLRKDGHPLAMHTTTYGVRNAAGDLIGYALVIRDVTLQRETEQKLHDSERRFQLLVGGLTEYAIFMLDRNGIVTSWNPGAERIQGHKAEDVVGQHFSLFYDDEHRRSGKPFRALKTAAESGRYEEEGWRLRKDGSQFAAHVLIDAIHDESGEVVAFATITRDITSRHRAARALRESESRFQLLLESITDHAICTLDPSGIVTSWNASAERIMGYTAAEVLGEHFSIFYGEAERKEGKPFRALEIACGEGRFAEEGVRLRKDGTAFAAEVVISPIRGEAGQFTGFAEVTRDISERKHREFAEAANEAKTRFLAHLSHELRTPLNAIIGFSEVIKSEIFGEIANKRYVSYGGDIHYSGIHLLNLVNDILDLSRVEAGKLEPMPERVDVNALAEKAMRLFDSKATAKQVRLELAPGDNVLEFVADERMVYQCCVNLLDNAIKFSKPNTRVALKVTRDAGWLRIIVADQGYGMQESEVPIALQPFRQLDSLMTRSTEGAGLGLSLVKSYCEIHGGGIAIRSAVDAGTEVTLRFPYPGGKKHTLSVATGSVVSA
jgi:PAS domain S-box-containing protein